MATRIPWRFIDQETTEEYILPLGTNPSTDEGSNGIQKAVKYESVGSIYVGSDNELRVDDMTIQDAPDEQPKLAYSGTIYTKDQYEAFDNWFKKDYPWVMIDDLDRANLVYVDKFTTERVRSNKFRWKHTYSFSGIILEEL